jgi:hypothetical protein
VELVRTLAARRRRPGIGLQDDGSRLCRRAGSTAEHPAKGDGNARPARKPAFGHQPSSTVDRSAGVA